MQFSIIICAHNVYDRLDKTLDSILEQSFDDYEVVIVDGASTDGTVDTIREYEEKFNGRLRWISESDSGIYNAMNKGVRMAKGEFLNVVGAGDWLEKNALEIANRYIIANPDADAVHGVLRIWDKECSHHYLLQSTQEKLRTDPMQHPALYYKKSLHDKYGLYDERYRIVADYLFCMKAFYVGDAVAVPFNVVVDNYVLDGISATDSETCQKENIRARRSLKLIPSRPMRFLYKLFKISY